MNNMYIPVFTSHQYLKLFKPSIATVEDHGQDEDH